MSNKFYNLIFIVFLIHNLIAQTNQRELILKYSNNMEDNKSYAPDYLSSTEDFVYLEHLHSWIIHENTFPEINFDISRFAQYAGDINGNTIDDLILNMGDADLEISGRKYVYGAVNR